MISTESFCYTLDGISYEGCNLSESSPQSSENDFLDSSSNSPTYEELVQMSVMDILPSTSFAVNPITLGPYLTIEAGCKSTYRFRYESEAGRHGGPKPIIKLNNYDGDPSEVYIKASLYTTDECPRPHVLYIAGKQCKDGIFWQKLSPDCIAKFPTLPIYTRKKEEIKFILKDRKKHELKQLRKKVDEATIEKEIKEELKTFNLACVKICFEAFLQKKHPVGDKIFSDCISNQKNPAAGDLKITRLSSYSGKCSGGEDIILLCDKIRKEDIEVHIYEKDDADQIIWREEGQFNPADVHHQVAIPFKTPPYKENKETSVWIALYRKSDEKYGEGREFRYIPDDNPDDAPSGKRKRSNFRKSSAPDACNEMTSNNETSSSSARDTITLPVPQECESPSCELDNYTLGGWELTSFLNDVFAVENKGLQENQFDLSQVNFSDIKSISFLSDSEENSTSLNMDATIDDFASLNLFKESQMKTTKWKKGVFEFSNEGEINKLKECLIQIIRSREWSSFLKFLPILMGVKDENNNNLLHLTIKEKSNDLTMLIRLLHVSPIDLKNEVNEFHQTPLHLAISKRLWKIVRILLLFGANPAIKDRDGNNCVHLAAKYNLPQCLAEILSFTANEKYKKCNLCINALNHEGLAPLHLSIMNESKLCTELLIKAYANINVTDGKSGKTPLHLAYEQGSKLIEYLLSQPDIDKKAVDFSGNAPETTSCDENLSSKSTQCYLKQGCVENAVNLKENIVKPEKITLCETTKSAQCCIEISSENNSDEEKSTSVSENANEISLKVESIDSGIEKKLCKILDSSGQWRKLGAYLMKKEMLDAIAELDLTPTRTILNQLEKHHGSKYSEELLYILRGDEFKEVIKMLKM